jgi:hypothetical protein
MQDPQRFFPVTHRIALPARSRMFPTASTYDTKDHIKAQITKLAGPSLDSNQDCPGTIGLMERDVAETEFPGRSPTLDEYLRRSLTDLAGDHGSDGAESVSHASDADTGYNVDMNKHYEAGMNSGTNINLRRLQEQLDRQPLDEIAMLVRALTYGEMIELAEGMWNVQPDGAAVTQENLPALLHRWSQSRAAVPAPVEYTHDQESDTE